MGWGMLAGFGGAAKDIGAGLNKMADNSREDALRAQKEEAAQLMEQRIYERTKADRAEETAGNRAWDLQKMEAGQKYAERLQSLSDNKAAAREAKTDARYRQDALKSTLAQATERYKALQVQLAANPDNEQLKIQLADETKTINQANKMLTDFTTTGEFSQKDQPKADPFNLRGGAQDDKDTASSTPSSTVKTPLQSQPVKGRDVTPYYVKLEELMSRKPTNSTPQREAMNWYAEKAALDAKYKGGGLGQSFKVQ